MAKDRGVKASAAGTKRKGAAVIVFMNQRMYLVFCKVGHSIHMCDEAKAHPVLKSFCGGDVSVYIAFFIHRHIHNSKLSHFIGQ